MTAAGDGAGRRGCGSSTTSASTITRGWLMPWCGSSTTSASMITRGWLMPWSGTAPLLLSTSSIARSSPGQGETSHADLKGKAPTSTLVVGPMKTPDSTMITNDDLFTERVTEALLKSIFLLVHREALKKSKNCPPRLFMRNIEGILMHADYSDEMLEQLLFALEDLKLLLAYKGSDLLVSFGSAEDVILKLVNQVKATHIFTEEEADFNICRVISLVESSISHVSFS